MTNFFYFWLSASHLHRGIAASGREFYGAGLFSLVMLSGGRGVTASGWTGVLRRPWDCGDGSAEKFVL